MKKKNALSAVCYGEVLWDVFPTHKKIGGAPLNVALRMNSMGVKTNMISRVGTDSNGDEIVNTPQCLGLFVEREGVPMPDDFLPTIEG